MRVLAIGQNVEEQNGKKVITGANATLELDPDQVNLIILAQHAGNSNLHLVLRSLVDSGGPAKTVVSADERVDGGSLRRPAAGDPVIRFPFLCSLVLQRRSRGMKSDRIQRRPNIIICVVGGASRDRAGFDRPRRRWR